ncbi:MAG: DUF4199 domain-containing protein [Bacteroidota bacterium]
MDTDIRIRENLRKTNNTIRTEKREREAFNVWQKSRKYGLVAGVIMAAYLLLLQTTGNGDSEFLKMLKYIPFIGIIYYGLSQYKKYLPKGKLFKNGLVFGIYVSAISALITTAIMTMYYGIKPETVEMTTFQNSVNSTLQLMLTDVMLALEIFGLGLISTFICLQGMKENYRDDIAK